MHYASSLTSWLGFGVVLLSLLTALFAVLAAQRKRAAAGQRDMLTCPTSEVLTDTPEKVSRLAKPLLAGLWVSVALCGFLLLLVLTVQLAVLALGVLAVYAVFLVPGLVMLVPVVLLICLLVAAVCFGLYWLGRYGYRRYTERRNQWQAQQLPWPPPTPPVERPIPWTQRQFKH
jgi:hypothetical protein